MQQHVKAIPCTQYPALQQACSLVGGNRGKIRRGPLAQLECKRTMELVRDWPWSLLLIEGVYNIKIKITQQSCLLGRRWLIRCLTAHWLLIMEQSSPSDCRLQPRARHDAQRGSRLLGLRRSREPALRGRLPGGRLWAGGVRSALLEYKALLRTLRVQC